jgi:hypothetical protein
LDEFKKITMDVLKKHDLAEYIAEQVYQSSSNPNVRDCVRIASYLVEFAELKEFINNIKNMSDIATKG